MGTVTTLPTRTTVTYLHRCATCRARLTLNDANPTLGCDDDGDVYCADHILDHITECRICGLEAHTARDQ